MSRSDSDHGANDTTGWIADTRLRGRPSVRSAMAQILDKSDTTLGISRSTLDHQHNTAILDISGLAQADSLAPSALEEEVSTRLNRLLGNRYSVMVTLRHNTVLHVRLREKEVKK